jgi:ABC-2 type transport system ATP-binding protein
MPSASASYGATVTAHALEATGLSKRFGDRQAVLDLSFAVERGEVLGLLGPNGAGKTTTIRLLSTVLAPSAGSFAVDGVPSTEAARVRRRVGVLAESSGYPRNQTGSEYLRYHARLFGMTRADAASAADRLLAEVGLADRSNAQISTYSRGMRQRLGIARAMVNEPAVVFLDEPTLGLDPAGQRQMLAIVREICDGRGASVVFSSHALAEVEEVCSTVLVMHEGRTIAYGRVADVIADVGLPPSARIQVPAEDAQTAVEALRGSGGVDAVRLHDAQGVLRVSALDAGSAQATGALNRALAALVDAGVPVLSYEAEGARLSDAFLAMTGKDRP